MRSRSAGGFGLAFYSMWRRDLKRHNWKIAARISPVSGRALGLSCANSCGWASRLQRPIAFVRIADLFDDRGCSVTG